MRARALFVMLALCAVTPAGAGEVVDGFKLPPEVTPKMRAACESDVRRLCLGKEPTVEKVKACVASKFMQLGKKCQMELAMAGFSG